MIDEELFSKMRAKVLSEEYNDEGIGALSEKVTHKILKLYYEPNTENHEVKYLGSVADVKNENGIIEVQTGALKPLTTKFRKFLPENKVTLVHPIVKHKTLKWIDKTTGEIVQTRKTTRRKDIYSVGFELYKIREFLTNPNFTLKLLLLCSEEYRILDGYGKDKKKHATKVESIPTKIEEEYTFRNREDYLQFLPDTLPEKFTSKDYKKAIKSHSNYDYYCLRLLLDLDLITTDGKQGNAIIYARKSSDKTQ